MTIIVLKVDALVNYIYIAICGDMLANYRVVSAGRDKMRQIHQELQGPGQDTRKTTLPREEGSDAHLECQIRRCLLSGYLKRLINRMGSPR